MKLPSYFKCPSDSSMEVPGVGGPDPAYGVDSPFSSWEFWGSSYPTNWYWPYYYSQAPPGNQSPYNGNFLTIVGGSSNVPGLGKHMLKDKGGRWASRFLVFYENRLNYAIEGASLRGAGEPAKTVLRGWHKQVGRYTVAFRDGSARYMEIDTRYVNGPGWTTWPNHPWEGYWEPYDELNP